MPTKGSAKQDTIHVGRSRLAATVADSKQAFFVYQLSKLELGVVELAQQHPDNTSLIARYLDEFQDEINTVVRPRIYNTKTSPTCAVPIEAPAEAPPSTILQDEQLGDYLPSVVVPNINGYDFWSSAVAPVSRIDDVSGYSNDPNAVADFNAHFDLNELQRSEINLTLNDSDPQPITTSEEPHTVSQSLARTRSNLQAEIRDDDRYNDVSPLRHSLESSRALQESRVTRKRTANEIGDTSSAFTAGSNKQRNRSERNKPPPNSSYQLSVMSDKINTDLQAFLDEQKLDNIASRPKLLKCVACFRDFSPLHHLKETLQIIRMESSFRLLPASTGIADTSEKLDQLDQLSSTCSVLHRVYLVRLIEYRDNLEALLKDEGSNPSLPKSKGSNKVATRVLQRMLEDMYPTKDFGNSKDCTHFKTLKKRLHNNLSAARKWSFIRDKFSLGMLFLIPAGPEYGINNQEYVCSSMTRIRLTSTALSGSRRTPFKTYLISYLPVLETSFSALQKL